MDGERFDQIVRTLGRGLPRRVAIKAVAGGALAAVLTRIGANEAAAACVPAGKRCERGDRCCAGASCKGGKCACDRGLKDCGKVCTECCTNGDCPSRVCRNGSCRAASCADGVKNADETDVDCGGACPKCQDGKRCAAAGDCVSGVCTDGTCRAPACPDSVKNGTETDVDCGGTACPACADGKTCAGNADCRSGHCCGGACRGCCVNSDCLAGQECNGGGQCVCTTTSCPSPKICRSDGTCCTPTKTTCASGNCGTFDNGCGGTVRCGECASYDVCRRDVQFCGTCSSGDDSAPACSAAILDCGPPGYRNLCKCYRELNGRGFCGTAGNVRCFRDRPICNVTVGDDCAKAGYPGYQCVRAAGCFGCAGDVVCVPPC